MPQETEPLSRADSGGRPGAVARVVGLSIAIQALVVIASLALPVLAPVAALDIGVDARLIGYYTSTIFVAGMAAALFAGGMVVRFGAIRVSQGMLLCAGAGLLLLPAATLPVLALSALAVGCAYGPTNPASSHLLARQTPPHLRGRVFALKQTSVPLGGALAGFAFPPLAAAIGWRAASALAGAACLALALALQRWRPDLDADRRPGTPVLGRSLAEPLRLILLLPELRRVSIASIPLSMAQFSVTSFFVTFLAEDVGVPLVSAGSALSVALIASLGARVGWGWLADRIGSPTVFVILCAGTAASLLSAAAIDAGWPFAAVAAVGAALGATAVGWNGVFLAEVAARAPPGQVSMATGGAMFCTYTGAFAGPAAFSLLVDTTGSYTSGFVAFAVLTSGGAALMAMRPAAAVGKGDSGGITR